MTYLHTMQEAPPDRPTTKFGLEPTRERKETTTKHR
jgi:hypothetical protein